MSDKHTTPREKDGFLARYPELITALWFLVPLLGLIAVSVLVRMLS